MQFFENQYEKIEPQEKEIVQKVVIVKIFDEKPNTQDRFADKCIVCLAKILNTDFVKVGCSSYRSADEKSNFVITSSKSYVQDKREKYWSVYRTNSFDKLSDCEKGMSYMAAKTKTQWLYCPFRQLKDNRIA